MRTRRNSRANRTSLNSSEPLDSPGNSVSFGKSIMWHPASQPDPTSNMVLLVALQNLSFVGPRTFSVHFGNFIRFARPSDIRSWPLACVLELSPSARNGRVQEPQDLKFQSYLERNPTADRLYCTVRVGGRASMFLDEKLTGAEGLQGPIDAIDSVFSTKAGITSVIRR